MEIVIVLVVVSVSLKKKEELFQRLQIQNALIDKVKPPMKCLHVELERIRDN